MTSFIDTHCHLDRLSLPPAEAVQQARDAGVNTLMTISVDSQTLEQVDLLVQEHPEVYGSLGIHPHDASCYETQVEEKIRKGCRENPKILAIGETGLDYHYLYSSKAQQQEAFRRQLELAIDLELPVVLHTREAEEDTLAILREIPVPQRGVAHSFTGSEAMARELVEMGWKIGINGIVTFKNAADLREVVQGLPEDSILLETDAPFLAPVPHRGKPNDPSKVPVIAKFLAPLLGMSLEQLAETTNHNAQSLFGFPPNSGFPQENGGVSP